MSNDIVARLRSLSDCDARAGEPLGKCMREAADEIKRLRAALREIALSFPYKQSSTLRRKARAALEGEASDDAAT